MNELSEKISAIIVDDEPHARQAMQLALAQHTIIDIIGECENGLAAVKAVNELKPQLLFLDIQMPKLDGFDVLELLGDDAPFVVFVTAFDEYALQAFEANAVDYLLKPLDPDRLGKCIDKITQRLTTNDRPQIQNVLADTSRDNGPLERILVRDGSDVHVIPSKSVCYIESADDYVAIQTEEATHIKLDRLNKLEERLDPRQFCRIHRSYLLNINYLARIETETKDTRIAFLQNGKQLPISRAGYGLLRKLL